MQSFEFMHMKKMLKKRYNYQKFVLQGVFLNHKTSSFPVTITPPRSKPLNKLRGPLHCTESTNSFKAAKTNSKLQNPG